MYADIHWSVKLIKGGSQMNFKKYIFGALFVAAVAVFAAQPAMAHSIKDLPPGLKKTSGVVPGMGEHYLDPKSKTIYGGYQGKIVFIEYEVRSSIGADPRSSRFTQSSRYLEAKRVDPAGSSPSFRHRLLTLLARYFS